MKKNTEELYYGYRVVAYISILLIGGGTAVIALGIAFTILGYSTWVLILCWILGLVLFVFGMFWQLTLGVTTDSRKVEVLTDVFSEKLATIWDGKGKMVDIGTGRGRLAVEIAKRFPEAQVIGVDTWTKKWSVFGQTKGGAEENARISKVSDRCTFQYGNALDLPFQDGEFQLVVSSFTFHEIHVSDLTVLFKEIARLLAPGGAFLILDGFAGSYLKAYKVTSVEGLIEKIQQLGFEDVKHEPLQEAGVDLGWFPRHFWEMDFLSGIKKS
jgi:SAM-dependent methyltransferase